MNTDKKLKYINLACGSNYVRSNDWINLDFTDRDGVQKVNLLNQLKFKESTFDAVYCSHFVEHIPFEELSNFLRECRRVLKDGGIFRVVVPDFEKMTREYIKQRDSGNSKKANFMMVSIIDQFVRNKPGGTLGSIFKSLEKTNDKEFKAYVVDRIGDIFSEDLKYNSSLNRKSSSKIFSFFLRKYINIFIKFLPKSFLKQNVSLADIGEMHKWIYDKYNLTDELKSVGFKRVEEVEYNFSNIINFPILLDTSDNGKPRKGLDSLFLEAIK